MENTSKQFKRRAKRETQSIITPRNLEDDEINKEQLDTRLSFDTYVEKSKQNQTNIKLSKLNRTLNTEETSTYAQPPPSYDTLKQFVDECCEPIEIDKKDIDDDDIVVIDDDDICTDKDNITTTNDTNTITQSIVASIQKNIEDRNKLFEKKIKINRGKDIDKVKEEDKINIVETPHKKYSKKKKYNFINLDTNSNSSSESSNNEKCTDNDDDIIDTEYRLYGYTNENEEILQKDGTIKPVELSSDDDIEILQLGSSGIHKNWNKKNDIKNKEKINDKYDNKNDQYIDDITKSQNIFNLETISISKKNIIELSRLQYDTIIEQIITTLNDIIIDKNLLKEYKIQYTKQLDDINKKLVLYQEWYWELKDIHKNFNEPKIQHIFEQILLWEQNILNYRRKRADNFSQLRRNLHKDFFEDLLQDGDNNINNNDYITDMVDEYGRDTILMQSMEKENRKNIRINARKRKYKLRSIGRQHLSSIEDDPLQALPEPYELLDGYSSDDETLLLHETHQHNNNDLKKNTGGYTSMIDRIILQAIHYSDMLYTKYKRLYDHIQKQKVFDINSYTRIHGDEYILQYLSLLIKYELILWDPFIVPTFKNHRWYEWLYTSIINWINEYPKEHNPDENCIPQLLSKYILPYITNILQYVWNPTSRTPVIFSLKTDYTSDTIDNIDDTVDDMFIKSNPQWHSNGLKNIVECLEFIVLHIQTKPGVPQNLKSSTEVSLNTTLQTLHEILEARVQEFLLYLPSTTTYMLWNNDIEVYTIANKLQPITVLSIKLIQSIISMRKLLAIIDCEKEDVHCIIPNWNTINLPPHAHATSQRLVWVCQYIYYYYYYYIYTYILYTFTDNLYPINVTSTFITIKNSM